MKTTYFRCDVNPDKKYKNWARWGIFKRRGRWTYPIAICDYAKRTFTTFYKKTIPDDSINAWCRHPYTVTEITKEETFLEIL
jgi:hypothetical protein